MKRFLLVVLVLAFALSAATAFAVPPLLVRYAFDGNVIDSSGNAKDGTLISGTAFGSTGRQGTGCLDLSAANGGVTVPALGTLDAFTISAWIFSTDINDWATLYATPGWNAQDVNIPLRQGAITRQVMCSVNGNSPTDCNESNIWATWPAYTWHLATIVYDKNAKTWSFYHDGVFVNTVTLTTALSGIFEASGSIGCWNSDKNNRPFHGKIDDFRIYGGAMTASDVTDLYNSYPTETLAAVSGVVYQPDGVTPATNAQVELKMGTTILQGPLAVNATTGAYSFAVTPGIAYLLRAQAPGFQAAKAAIVPSASVVQDLTLAAIPAAPTGPVISIDAIDATASGWVNHGAYGGAFVPVTGTANVVVGPAGSSGDLRSGVTFGGTQWLHLMDGSDPIYASEWITGAAPHSVISWIYDPAPASSSQGQRDIYLSWAPMRAPVGGGMYLGLGWQTWGGAVACADCNASPWINWPGNNADFATAMTNMAANNVPYGRWAQIATVYDGTSYRIYVDGVERSDMGKPYANNIACDDYQIYLGGSANSTNPNAKWGDSTFIGTIGRLKMYARALTASEVAADFSTPPPSMLNVSGFVRKSDGTPLVGAVVRVTDGSGAVVTSATSKAPDGAFTASGWSGVPYTLKAAMAGYRPASQAVTLPHTGSVTLQLTKKSIVRESDLLFAVSTGDLPDSGRIDTWPAIPANPILTEGAPSVVFADGIKWEKNLRTSGDGFLFSQDAVSSIPCNGATIVTAVKPIRNAQSDNYNSLVSVFLNQLEIGIRNNSGALRVSRGGVSFEDSTSPIIPDGQVTLLSLVVQPTGEFKVYANGTQIWQNTTPYAFTQFSRDGAWYMRDISLGRGFRNDNWSAQNAYIGSTYVYKVALNPTELAQAQVEVGTDLGITRAISGKVVNSSNGRVAGASILINGSDTGSVTAADGTYTIQLPLFAGPYTVSATKNNYSGSSEVPVTVTTGTITYPIADIVMDPLPDLLTISGTVRDVATSLPAANVKLLISSSALLHPYTTQTDSLGRYSVQVVYGINYTVDLDPAQVPAVAMLTPLAGRVAEPLLEDWPLDLSVTYPSTLTGKVVTTDASTASGYSITAKDAGGAIVATATTAADGTYSLSVNPVRVVKVAARKRGYVTMPAPQSINVATGSATYPVGDFTASPGGVITGILRDATTQQPIYNAVVQSCDVLDPAVVTDASGAFSLAVTGCGGADLYADAINYRGKLVLVTGGSGGLYKKDIFLTPEAETLGLNGNMEDLSGSQPTQWQATPWSGAGTIDWSASTTAKSGLKSLFYTPTATPEAYAGIYKTVALTPGYSYNFYFSAKADPEVARWQPLFEFHAADGSGINLGNYISSDPAYPEYAHTPPYNWYTYLNWGHRSSTGGGTLDPGPAIRRVPPDNAALAEFIFLYEPSAANNINGNTTNLPIAGKGCYIDDLVIDAVPAILPSETVVSDATGVSIAGLTALKNVADGTSVILSGPETVIYAPKNGTTRTTTFFYVAEKQGMGGLQVRYAAGDSLTIGQSVNNLTGVYHAPAGAEPYLQLITAPVGGNGTAIAPVGANNKAAMTDAKIKTNAVRVWGRVKSVNSTTMVISDGYQSDITINVNGLSVTGIDNTKTAVVTGVVSMDGTVQAQAISAF